MRKGAVTTLLELIMKHNRALEGLLKITDSHKTRLEALEDRVKRLEYMVYLDKKEKIL